MLVESLQVQRGQVCQRDAADLRLDVVFQKALRGFEGGRSEFYSGVVLHPHLQPATYRVGLGPSVVDAHIFLDGFLEFLFHFRLRLAEDIFDDGLASFWIVADGVASFPASVLSLSDIPFPVCSSFRHGISPFRNEQYRNQGNKATEKPNCYQKVIICPSEPRRLIFDYCGAIFALPGRSLWFQRCDFRTDEIPFYCLVQNKHSTRSGYEASETMLIFVIMGGQWMDGFFGEPSARAVNSPPPSCYKDSIEQVAPAMPRARHEPN